MARTNVDRDAKEALQNYTSEQLLQIQRECVTVAGKVRIQRELQRRRDNDARAERQRANRRSR